jgi:outer membrane protein OmpA-like peptidoglycan-associated protein
LLLGCAVGWSVSAWAGFGATGAVPAIPSADALQPLLSWRAFRPVRGEGSAAVVFEAAANPLEQTVVDPITGAATRVGVVRDLAGFRAGGRWSVSDRLEVGASFPLWIQATSDLGAGGAGPGDLAFTAAWRAIGGERGALSIAPSVTLPTGAQAKYLGDPGPGAAVLAIGGVRGGPAEGTGWFGVEQRFFRAEANIRGGPGLVGGLNAGVALDPRFGVHLGWRFDQRLLAGDVDAGAPEDAPRRIGASELALSVQGELFSGWFVTAGLGGQTREGPGAANLRMWLGAGRTFGRQEQNEPVTPGKVWTVTARAPDGEPVAGAVLLIDGEAVATADTQGKISVSRPRRPRSVTVDGDGVREVALTLEGLDAGEVNVELPFDPVKVRVRVQDSQGATVPGRLDATGASGEITGVELGGPTADLELAPGTWEIRASASGFGEQRRTLVLNPRDLSAEEVTFLLLPVAGDRAIRVRLVDVEANPVAAATLAIGGLPVGTSGSGGDFWVGGLADAPVVLDAQADTFRDYSRPEVVPANPPAELELVLTRERGAVQVVVRGPEGRPVADAGVRFVGVDRIGPFPMPENGRRTFVLRPGPWQLLVSSAQYGSQQRALDIPDRDGALEVVEVVLRPPEDGDGELVVRVVDPDNQPVAGVEVALDGNVYGTTSTGGEVTVAGLRDGPRMLRVSGDRHETYEQNLLLSGGVQERTVVLGWKEGTTLILARGPQGMVQDASARFGGPLGVAPIRLGTAGFSFVDLDPGAWQVLVASPRWGAQQHGVAIPPGSRSLHVVDAVLALGQEGAGRLGLQVVDPEGRPVRGASLRLDGTELGATSSAGVLNLVELATGERTIEVTAPGYLPAKIAVKVGVNDQVVTVPLQWGVGAVRVQVVDKGVVVPAATVRWGGSRFVPASPVDAQGTRLFTLEPGTWQVLATAPGRGAAQVRVAIAEEPRLTQVVVDMAADAVPVPLVVKVQDPEGKPIPGAVLSVDGGKAVLVGEGGLAVLSGIQPGPHRMTVRAPQFQEVRDLAVLVAPEGAERVITLDWAPRTLLVKVEGPTGSPLAGAVVRAEGSVAVPEVVSDSAGSAILEVRPGRWSVSARTDTLGPRAVEVILGREDAQRTTVLRLLPAKVSWTGGQVLVEEVIHFDVAESTLRPESAPLLDEVAAVLLANPEIVRIEIAGHTDPIGGVAFNTELSRRRAKAVAEALVERGIAPERLVAKGYGPSRPIADNETVEGRAANRRVEFTVAP